MSRPKPQITTLCSGLIAEQRLRQRAVEDLSLPIEWDVPGELEHRDMGDERGRGYATLNQAGRALGLDDRSLTGPAGVLREDRSLHPHRGRDHVESLARLLANPMERSGAAG